MPIRVTWDEYEVAYLLSACLDVDNGRMTRNEAVRKVSQHLRKNYRRKISAFEDAWNCATYLKFGKAACPSKKIPEDVIMSNAASVLGMDSFDPDVFKEKISEIRVPGPNRLIYVLKDGTRVEREWLDKSRSASWTPEMRRKAAEAAARRYAV